MASVRTLNHPLTRCQYTYHIIDKTFTIKDDDGREQTEKVTPENLPELKKRLVRLGIPKPIVDTLLRGADE